MSLSEINHTILYFIQVLWLYWIFSGATWTFLPWVQLQTPNWFLWVQAETTAAEIPQASTWNPSLRLHSFSCDLATSSLSFLENIVKMVVTRQLCHVGAYRPPPCLSIWLLGWLAEYQRAVVSLPSPYSHEHGKLLFILSAPYSGGDTELFWYWFFKIHLLVCWTSCSYISIFRLYTTLPSHKRPCKTQTSLIYS